EATCSASHVRPPTFCASWHVMAMRAHATNYAVVGCQRHRFHSRGCKGSPPTRLHLMSCETVSETAIFANRNTEDDPTMSRAVAPARVKKSSDATRSRQTATLSAGATSSGAAILSRVLYRRAWHVAIRAEHAAIPGLRVEHRAAALAFIEELAGVRWHRLGRLMATGRAGD